MFLSDIFEDNNASVLVVYPGRFQPFHKGHKAVYDHLVKMYGRDSVFIATSNKVEQPKSPFSFSDKAQFMALTGVPADRIIESTQPYKAEELTRHYNPSTTRLIFAVSEKDMAEDPRFKSWTKKDGSPAYFQPMPASINDMESFDKHGYIQVVPTVDFTVMGQPMRSATEVRALFARSNEQTRKQIVADLFGRYSDNVYAIMVQKLAGGIEESRVIFSSPSMPINLYYLPHKDKIAGRKPRLLANSVPYKLLDKFIDLVKSKYQVKPEDIVWVATAKDTNQPPK